MKKNKTILLVEDEAILAECESETIKKFGYNVLTTNNGGNAVQIAPDADLVLMDIDLGKGIDGTETARRILEKKKIPIVFLTSHAEREMVERVKGITRYGYVIKNSGDFVLQSSIEMAFELFDAHEKTSESEARQRTLIQTIPDLIWLKDAEGVYLACNPTFEKFFGASAEDIIGRTDYDFVDKDLADFFREHDRKAMASAQPSINEEWITFASDGHRTLLETIKMPMFERDGRLIGVLGIGRDITERKRAGEALLESEQRYKQLLGSVTDYIYTVQVSDGRPVATVHSIGCEAVTGYKPEDYTDDPDLWYRIVHDPDRQAVKEQAARALSGAEILPLEYRIYHKDGSIRWVRNTIVPRYDEQHRLMSYDGLIEDISERKRMDEALRESEKKVRRKLDAILSPETEIEELELSDIIDSEKIQKLMDDFYQLTNVGIGIIDLKGKVLVGTGWQDICTKFHRINQESCRLCIESDLELIRNVPIGTFKQYRCKNNMWDIVTPIMLGDNHVGNIFLGQFLFDDEKPEYEVFRQQARQYGFNEQEYIAALDRVPRWSQQKVNTVMSFYTAFAGMIGDLSYSNIKLAKVLEYHKQAKTELIQSGHDKEFLLKEMQHRMKNTLGIVSSFLSLERSRVNDKNLYSVLDDSIARIQAIGRIYQQLYQTNGSDTIDLKRYIEEMAQQLLNTYALKTDQVRLFFELDDVMCDMKRAMNIGLILNELLINVIKHAFPPETKGAVRIELSKTNERIILTISDDGKGMNDDFAAGKDKGMGLHIVDLLAKEMGGDFSFESIHGTTTRLEIPL